MDRFEKQNYDTGTHKVEAGFFGALFDKEDSYKIGSKLYVIKKSASHNFWVYEGSKRKLLKDVIDRDYNKFIKEDWKIRK